MSRWGKIPAPGGKERGKTLAADANPHPGVTVSTQRRSLNDRTKPYKIPRARHQRFTTITDFGEIILPHSGELCKTVEASPSEGRGRGQPSSLNL